MYSQDPAGGLLQMRNTVGSLFQLLKNFFRILEIDRSRFCQAYPTMGLNPVLKAFVVLVIGGVGNLWGAIVGGFLLGILEILVAGYISSQLQDIGTFSILVLVLIFRPNGLFGRAEVIR